MAKFYFQMLGVERLAREHCIRKKKANYNTILISTRLYKKTGNVNNKHLQPMYMYIYKIKQNHVR